MTGPRLIYVMGPSGAGKDAVMGYARARLGGRYDVTFAHRYITRPPTVGHENYVSLDVEEFELRRRKGLFLFDWEAHGFRYAVGAELNLWLAAGLTTVVSGSRAHFASAGSALATVSPVMIEAAPEELRRRLVARGREPAPVIAERLARGSAFRIAHPSLAVIDNSGPLEAAGERFLQLLKDQRSRGATS